MKTIRRLSCAILAGILLCGALAFALPDRDKEVRDAPIRTVVLEAEQPGTVDMKVGEQVQIVLSDAAEHDTDAGGSADTTQTESGDGSGWTQPGKGIWYSEREDIASVDETGRITAKAEGKTTVYMSVPQGVVSCEVVVTGYAMTGMELFAQSDMRVGESQTIQAEITPKEAADTKLEWSSDNTDILTVNQDGVVTAVGVGKATITAKAENGMTADMAIVVTGYVIESISVEPSALTMYVGDSKEVTVTTKPEGSDPGKLTWESSNTSVAYYKDGKIEAKAAGEAVITVTNADGMKAECTVTVKDAKLSLNYTTYDKLKIGETVTLKATVTPEGLAVAWSSDNPAVATVDKNGKVTGKKPGQAVITAKAGGLQATCKVTVINASVNPVKPSNINPSNAIRPFGNTGATGITNGITNRTPYYFTNSIGTGGVLYIPGAITQMNALYTMPANIPSAVYLTVDSALDANTESSLNQLSASGMYATFFVPIDDLYQADDMLRHIAGSGNSIGFLLTPEQAAAGNVQELLENANQQISVITGTPTRLVRIAGGSSGNITSETAAALITAGYRVWDWNTAAREDTMTADSCYQAIVGAMNTTGTVTIQFGSGANTASVLQQLLPYMKYCGIPADRINAADTAVCNTAIG